MPDKDSLFIHSIGSKIRLYRKYRGLTQKELGDACGLNESTIRNYELGNRYPDKQTLTQIADTLHIDVFSLLDPDPTDPTGAIHVLFDIERCYGLIPKEIDGRLCLVLDQDADAGVKKALTSSEKLKRLQFQESLALWEHVRKVYDEGNLLDEEYDDWKSAWPDFIDKDQMYGSRNCRVRIKRLPHRIPGLKRKENASRRSRIRTDRGCEVKKSRVFHPVNSWTDVPNGTKREIRRKNLHHSFSDD